MSFRIAAHSAEKKLLIGLKQKRQWCHETSRRYHELAFSQPGEPSRVLQYNSSQLHYHSTQNDAIKNPVRVEMLHAPLNPADINLIQGNYPSPLSQSDETGDMIRKSPLDKDCRVAGSEGLGIVTHVEQDNVHHLHVGNVVTLARSSLGTFRSSFWTPADTLVALKRGQELLPNAAPFATLPQIGGTALNMLRHGGSGGSTTKGGVVIQNAGNSAVGLLVSQLAHVLYGVQVVSIVRRGNKTQDEWQQLVQYLQNVGKCAKVVAQEDLLASKDTVKELQSEIRKLSGNNELAQLGLNAVGGESASLIQQCLGQGGTCITYGGMSMKPIITSTSQLIFRDLKSVGYWHSRWMVENSLEDKTEMLNDLVDVILDNGLVCPPIQEFELKDYQDALSFHESQSAKAIRRKVVFRCEYQDQKR